MILRAKGSGNLRRLAICCLIIGVATAIAGSFVGLWLIVGGAAIAAPGLFLLILGSPDDTKKVMEQFNKELMKPQPSEERKDA